MGHGRLALAARLLYACTIAPAFVSRAAAAEVEAPRQRVSLDADWRFQKDDPADAKGELDYSKLREWVVPTGNPLRKFPAGTTQPARPAGNPGENVSYVRGDFDDGGWRLVDLPHDWAIEGPFDPALPGETGKRRYWGAVWYRKHLTVPRAGEGKEGKRFFLQVDGAMSYATVWLNGHFLGGWPYGYSSFQLDLTPHVKAGGDNVIAVRLDCPPDSSRWYPGAGIYRDVWLIETSPVHVGQWGTYVTTPQVAPDAATVDVRAEIDNDSGAPADVTVQTKVYDGGAGAASAEVATSEPQKLTLGAGARAAPSANISLKNPKLWDVEQPHLYTAVTTVEQNDKLVDRYETVFGVRTIRFDAEQGFLLNGKHVPLRGVCDHHDLGALGAAWNTRAAERQLQTLKEMGFNSLRTSHNPPAPGLLDLCDRMGVVVMDESFDCWRRGKTKGDYHLLWDDWHEADLRAEYRRDRNHPSIILWSVGNEVPELRRPAEGAAIGAALTAIANDEDPTRPTVLASNVPAAGTDGIQKSVGLYGQNYSPNSYANFRKANPALPLVASETSSCVSSRGEYYFPVTDKKSEGRGPFQVSSYDLYAPPWACSPDEEFKALDANPFPAGEYVWTGFDYLGEPTPFNADVTNLLNFNDPAERAAMEKELKEQGKIRSPSRSSYFGIVDLCGFRKDRFYLYQARWRPDLPMAHILPHWNWPDRAGQITPVHVYTSGDEAELFLNGHSLGRKKRGPTDYRLRWDDVKYEPGELHVVAYRGGRQWAKDTVRTTGPAAKLTLKADRDHLTADGKDLSFVTVSVVDDKGLLVPRSSNLATFEISGPGQIAAVDNGDATSHAPFQVERIKAFNGLALVIVRTKPGQAGAITLRARAEGLGGAEVELRSQAGAREVGER